MNRLCIMFGFLLVLGSGLGYAQENAQVSSETRVIALRQEYRLRFQAGQLQKSMGLFDELGFYGRSVQVPNLSVDQNEPIISGEPGRFPEGTSEPTVLPPQDIRPEVRVAVEVGLGGLDLMAQLRDELDAVERDLRVARQDSNQSVR